LLHGCFAGKCILTGSTEEIYFKVDGSMEKKWDTVTPADLKRLFVAFLIPSIQFFFGLPRKAMNERNPNESQWEDRKKWSLGVGQRRKTF
jgi:hypothetical protein